MAWPGGQVIVGLGSHRSEIVPLFSWSWRAREEFQGQLEAARLQAGCGLAEAMCISGCLVALYHLPSAMVGLSHEITTNFTQDRNL